ncbi:hypothetical protein SCUCBS95973_000553 [Sporothrix curviconia]|uniref:DNA-binding protein RAP1 n=1 Tax=Sporothrix curviconia TaxID=1260050 RepID=A0ABP0ARB0_9PEZI
MPFSFEGLKFWVSIHTPNRTKSDIKKHGGIVVVNEVDADVRIVDPARAGSNPSQNMISPDWITERVRNEYTHEDDRILIQWMYDKAAEATRKGIDLGASGNKIYKDLEALHPHHTYHSWRSRWLTKLSMITDLSVPPESSRRSQPEPRPEHLEQISPVQPRPPAREPGAEPEPNPPQEQSLEEEEPQNLTEENIQDPSGAPDELFFMDYNDYYIIGIAYTQSDLSAQEWQERYNKVRSMYVNGSSSKEAQEEAAVAKNRNEDDSGGEGEGEDEDEDGDGDGDDGLDIDVDAIIDGVETLDNRQQQFLGCLDAYNEFLQVYVPPSFFIGGRYLETYTLWTAVQEASSGEQDKRDWGAIVSALGLDSDKYPALETQLAAWYDQNLKELGSFLKEYQQEAEGDDDEEGDSSGDGGDDNDDDEEEKEQEQEQEQAGTQDGPRSGKTPVSAARNSGLLSSARQILSAAFSGGSRATTAEGEPAAETPSKRVRFSGRTDAEANNDSDDDDDTSGSPAFETRRRTTRASARKTAAAPGNKATEPETQDFAYALETQQPDVDMEGEEEEDRRDEGSAGTGATPHGRRVATPSQQLQTEERIMAAVPLSLPALGPSRLKRPAESSTPGRHAGKRTARQSMPPDFDVRSQRGQEAQAA